jgi:hypothetical protein
MSFKLPSQLSENQIESDVASYLGLITPIWSQRFRLISVDEQTTGADKLLNHFIPIYLQFKVSEGLNPNGSIPQFFLNRPLSKIISFRSAHNLAGNPILYFPLRKMARTATDFQHNILRQLHNPPKQFSLYVAPLTLDRTEYEKSLNVKWLRRLWPIDPYFLKEFEIYDPTIGKNLILGLNPFLRHHISIPPHTTVTTHKHHYSYSQSGGDVAWHGGEILNDDFRLSTQWLRILNYAYSQDNVGFNREAFINFINDFISTNEMMRSRESYINNFPDTIVSFARSLKSYYNIKLMLLSWK